MTLASILARFLSSPLSRVGQPALATPGVSASSQPAAEPGNRALFALEGRAGPGVYKDCLNDVVIYISLSTKISLEF